MKKICCFLPFAIAILVYGCHRECDTFSGRVLTTNTENYFGLLKPGNSWIYQNHSQTKTDSIYITGYTDSLIKNTTNCTAYESRRFTIHNLFLANGNDIPVTYDATETVTTFKMETPGTNFPWFSYVSTDSLVRSLPAADNPGSNRLDSVKINTLTYYTVLIGKRAPASYYFAKDKSLVGWITATDTFNLVRAHIQ